jgi:hypothetical protein
MALFNSSKEVREALGNFFFQAYEDSSKTSVDGCNQYAGYA